MATFHDRTIAPKFQRGLLRAGGVPCRVLTSDEVVAEVEADFASLIAQPWPEVVSTHSGNYPVCPTVLHGETRCDIATPDVRHGGARGLLPTEPKTAAEARALHSRRALERAADHGVALLAALGLPQPMRHDIKTHDPAAIGDALDLVIAHLDALDAPGEDLEPSLVHPYGMGWHDPMLPLDGEDDSEDFEETSLETAGRGFVRAGADDAEEDDPAEMDDEPEGDGGEPYLSVVEFDGSGDNWRRSGQPTMGLFWTDVEAVNEDGDDCGEAHAPWWDRIGYEVAEGVHG